MKVLITGSSGYIGTNLCRYCKENGIDITQFDIKRGRDVRNISSLRKLVKGNDGIIHLAARTSIPQCEKQILESIEHNVYGTKNASQVAYENGVPLVYASTFAIPAVSVYGFTKGLGEKFVLQDGGVVVRLGNVYGGVNDRRESVINNFRKAKKNGEKAVIYGDGMQTRDFIDVYDVCVALIQGLSAESGLYEATTGITMTINTLAELFKLNVEYIKERKGDLKHVTPDKSRWIPNWKPTKPLYEWVNKL